MVIFQETKIQRKDLTDDMVLVPGWDCFFSLPRYKKGMPFPLDRYASDELLSVVRLFWGRHLYAAVCLCSDPRRRGHHWSFVSPELHTVLFDSCSRSTDRGLSYCRAIYTVYGGCSDAGLRRKGCDSRISSFRTHRGVCSCE